MNTGTAPAKEKTQNPQHKKLNALVVRAQEASSTEECNQLLGEVYEAVRPYAIKVADRYHGTLRKAGIEFEDVFHHVLLKFCDKIKSGKYDPEKGNFAGLFAQAISNYMIDIGRKNKRHPPPQTIEGVDEVRLMQDTSAQPGATMEQREDRKKIEIIINELPADFMQPLRNWVDGIGYKESAEIIGVNEGTLKSRIWRAKQAVRDRIKPEDFGWER